jgi:hypothetical protein
MPRTKSEPDEIEMIASAYLAGENYKQTLIATTLGISQAAVSRHLARARLNYFREEVRFLSEKVAPEIMQRVLQRVSRNDLAEKLDRFAKLHGRRAPVLRVFTCPTSSPAGSAIKDELSGLPVSAERNPVRWKRMAELSRFAAPYIRDLILRSKVCGVTWGGMLSQIAIALQGLSIAPPWKEDGAAIEIVPLSGEPLGDAPTTFSSSSVAEAMGLVVNGPQYHGHSLAMVPAFVPDKFSKAQTAGVWKLIGLVPAYAHIFGKSRRHRDEHCFAFHLDMVLTSVGPSTSPLGFGRGRLFQTGNLKKEDLQKLVIGDMGGVCFERSGLTAAQRDRLAGVAGRWTGWSRGDLDRCADRAAASDPFNGPPGIVVVSVGRERAQFLLDAVALGRVNHLIIDDELQQEMEKLLAERLPAEPSAPDR